MKKIQFKRIIRVFLFTLVIFSFFIIYNVRAEGEDGEVKDNTGCKVFVRDDGSKYSEECLIGPEDESWNECINALGAAKFRVMSNEEMVNLFGFSIARDDKNNYVLKMKPKTTDKELLKELENFQFKVLRINNTYDKTVNSAVGATVDPKNNLTFKADLVDPTTLKDHEGKPIPDSALNAFVIVLQNVSVVSDKIGGSLYRGDSKSGLELVKCKGVVRVSITYSSGGAKVFEPNLNDEGEDDPNKEEKAAIRKLKEELANLGGGSVQQEIDCNNVLKACPYSVDSPEFEKCLLIHDDEDSKATALSTKERMALNFCVIKKKAERAGHTYSFDKEKTFEDTDSTKNTTIGGKCSKDKFVLPSSNMNAKSEYQFLNKDYYFATGSSSITLKNTAYSYTYSGSSKTKKVGLSCDLDCDESIVVEYGPPQAATAGLCIEYQVRVTSIVSCKSTFDGKEPSIGEVCYPAPNCQGNHGDSRIFDQGGPNLTFDSCIKSCDGGKYTSKCNKKCYNQVYGSSTALKKSDNSSNSVTATKVANHCKDYADSWGGYYYRSGSSLAFDGKIAHWYRTHVTSRGGYSYTFNDFAYNGCWWSRGEGFPRVTAACNIIYSGACDDRCWFSGCSETQYLNNCDALNEYYKNLEIYKAAVSDCKSAATCRTSTTEFTMKVTNGEDTEIIFPYTKDKSKTKTELVSEDIKFNDNNKAVFKYNKEILLRYGGCYYNTAVVNWYHGWWSFPGTWVHNKSKAVSFSEPEDVKNWTKVSNKFCIPYNFKDENQEWYKYYISQAYKQSDLKAKTGSSLSYYDDKGRYCTTTTDYEELASAPNVKYNIIATSNGFGYFKWKVKVDCFYAYSKSSTLKKANTKCVEKSENNFRIRSVDLKDLFPDKSGYVVGATDQFGREPGFNWSKLSTERKIDSYTSFPDTYAKQVQELNTQVYSDSYLDYQFVLTPDSLSKIRKQLNDSSNSKYNSFTGDIVNVDGVNHYVSKMFRNNSTIASENKSIPKDFSVGVSNSALRCNNMVNHKSNQCYVCDSTTCKGE